jgi:Tol biopolymer transport system component
MSRVSVLQAFALSIAVVVIAVSEFAGVASAADRIYFTRSDADSKPDSPKLAIYSMAADGSDQKQVTKGTDLAVDPAVSPNGKILACTIMKLGDGPPTGSITVMNLDGSGMKTLAEGKQEILVAPAWSPNGTQLTFSALELAGGGPPKSTLYVMGADGSNRKQIGEGLMPKWLPEGKQIAYSVMQPDGDRLPALFIMDADGKNSKSLVEGVGMMAIWSPNGKQVAFMSDGGGQADLFVMNADGSNKKQLTQSAEFEIGPLWLSDGKRIVFTRMPLGGESPGQGAEIFSIAADGADEKQLTKNDVIDATSGGSMFLLQGRGSRTEGAERAQEKETDKK